MRKKKTSKTNRASKTHSIPCGHWYVTFIADGHDEGCISKYQVKKGGLKGLDGFKGALEEEERKDREDARKDKEEERKQEERKEKEEERKEKEDERKEKEEERKIRAEQREEKEYTMKEFEKVTDLLRKSREDLSDTNLSPEDREDLLYTHRLLINQKKKLQQMLFSTS